MTTENPRLIPNESTPEAIEHQNVPQEHRGLHDFLYDSADEHSVAPVPSAEIALDTLMPIAAWCDEAQNAKVAGVYAVFDRQQQPQYIGYSRNVTLSLRSHLSQHGEEICAFVKAQPFKFPKREEMEQLRAQWLAELPNLPPGNSIEGADWAGTVRDAATQAMSAAERAVYEEKKLKLRRAMADGTLHSEIATTPATADRQQALAAQLQNDNWSAVISEQSRETHES